MEREFSDVKHLKIHGGRWGVVTTITLGDDSVVEYVASADSALAESGIYFGTREEYEEDLAQWI